MAITTSGKQSAQGSTSGLSKLLNTYRPDLTPYVDLYKDIHQHPELSGLERETGRKLAELLRSLGLEVRSSIGGYGVAAILRNGSGKTILLRAELDALPFEEETGLPYASTVRMKDTLGQEQPVMHACGHDVHMACLLAAVHLLKSAIKEWSGTVLVVLQPNEETPGGAQAMIDDGLYEFLPRPDIMLAQHVGMSKAGLVAVRTGAVLPASDYIEIHIRSNGLGPNPTECPDPVSTASYLVTRFQRVIGTDIDHHEFASLICRDFQAGEPNALYTNSVYMRLEVKTTNKKTSIAIVDAVKAIVEAECSIYEDRLVATINTIPRAPVTENDEALATCLQRCFKTHFGDRFWIPAMDTPIEDFSLLSGPDPVPFVYWKLGCTEPDQWDRAAEKGGRILEHLPANHSPKFAPAPELTIRTGTDAMALATLLFFHD